MWLKVSLAVALATLVVACNSSSPAQDSITIQICIDDQDWTRPTLEEQVHYINGDGRYRPFDDIKESQFAAAFWIGAGPATSRPNPFGKLMAGSGLWTLDAESDIYAGLQEACPDEPNLLRHPELADIWLFGFGALEADWQDRQTTITVVPRPSGFQAIQLRYPGPTAGFAGPFIFVDASGRTVGTIEEDAFWSTAP